MIPPPKRPVDLARLPTKAEDVNALAWPLVDPERADRGGEAKGLVLARRAVQLAADLPPKGRAPIHNTLAWALLAAGRFDEAITEQERAVGEAGAEQEQVFQAQLAKLEQAIEFQLSPEGLAQDAKHLGELESRLIELEAEVSVHPEWTFDDDQDRWWHDQLQILVEGIRSFADPDQGLFGRGISAEHGWAVEKRLAFAETVREVTIESEEAARRWREAIDSIASVAECPAYAGLRIEPQLGLLPIGRDPDSGLWEFAHLQTGEAAQRGADDKLVLEEETGLVFVLLPGGPFTMGAQASDPAGPNYDPQARPEEGPPHEVRITPFFLSKYELMQGQWQRFTARNPSRFGPHNYGPDFDRSGRKPDLLHPVDSVTWLLCSQVCGRLALELPSEAQWEYGARGGTTTPWWTGREPTDLATAANLADAWCRTHSGPQGWVYEDWEDGHTVHAAIGSFAPNPFGLFDVHGNTWEWCRDAYEDGFYRRSPRQDPVADPAHSLLRVHRGGGFHSPAAHARSASRLYDPPDYTGHGIGLRPAKRIR